MPLDNKMSFLDEGGNMVEGWKVGILQSKEKFSHIELEDGAILAIKASPISVMRVAGAKDDEGNPKYIVKNTVIITVVSSPDQEGA